MTWIVLIQVGRWDDAETTIEKLWGKAQVDVAMKELRSVSGSRGVDDDVSWSEILSKPYFKGEDQFSFTAGQTVNFMSFLNFYLSLTYCQHDCTLVVLIFFHYTGQPAVVACWTQCEEKVRQVSCSLCFIGVCSGGNWKCPVCSPTVCRHQWSPLFLINHISRCRDNQWDGRKCCCRSCQPHRYVYDLSPLFPT